MGNGGSNVGLDFRLYFKILRFTVSFYLFLIISFENKMFRLFA